jgi:hypothetical protein
MENIVDSQSTICYSNGVDGQSTKKGGDQVTDTVKLLELINKSGLKLGYIASQMGISRFTLYNKIQNRTEFRVSEIIKMCELLCIDYDSREQVFFAHKVD